MKVNFASVESAKVGSSLFAFVGQGWNRLRIVRAEEDEVETQSGTRARATITFMVLGSDNFGDKYVGTEVTNTYLMPPKGKENDKNFLFGMKSLRSLFDAAGADEDVLSNEEADIDIAALEGVEVRGYARTRKTNPTTQYPDVRDYSDFGVFEPIDAEPEEQVVVPAKTSSGKAMAFGESLASKR